MRTLTSLLALVGACALSSAAHADTINQYTRAAFQTALASSALSGQNFDSLPTGTITTVNGVTYTPSSGTALVTNGFLTTTSPNGLGSTSFGFFGPNDALTISFNAPITAFALDINTFASNPGDYMVTINNGSGITLKSLFDVFPATATGQFIGFTDSVSFTSLTLAAVNDPGTGNGFCGGQPKCPYTVDTLVYGDRAALPGGGNGVTPEPSSLTLLGTGIVGLAGLLRRRIATRR